MTSSITSGARICARALLQSSNFLTRPNGRVNIVPISHHINQLARRTITTCQTNGNHDNNTVNTNVVSEVYFYTRFSLYLGFLTGVVTGSLLTGGLIIHKILKNQTPTENVRVQELADAMSEYVYSHLQLEQIIHPSRRMEAMPQIYSNVRENINYSNNGRTFTARDLFKGTSFSSELDSKYLTRLLRITFFISPTGWKVSNDEGWKRKEW